MKGSLKSADVHLNSSMYKCKSQAIPSAFQQKTRQPHDLHVKLTPCTPLTSQAKKDSFSASRISALSAGLSRKSSLRRGRGSRLDIRRSGLKARWKSSPRRWMRRCCSSATSPKTPTWTRFSKPSKTNSVRSTSSFTRLPLHPPKLSRNLFTK